MLLRGAPDNARPQQVSLLIMGQVLAWNLCGHSLRVWGTLASQSWHLQR